MDLPVHHDETLSYSQAVFRENLRRFGLRAGVVADMLQNDQFDATVALEDLRRHWKRLLRSRLGLGLVPPLAERDRGEGGPA